MSRLRLTVLVLGLALAGFFVARQFHGQADPRGHASTFIRLLTEPQVVFAQMAKEAELRIRGGIGVTLISDPSGLVRVHSASAGSPAAFAGFKGEELISHVDGKPVLGVPFTNVIDLFRGFNGTRVELTVLKPGSTNWDSITLRRVSMKKAFELRSRSPYE